MGKRIEKLKGKMLKPFKDSFSRKEEIPCHIHDEKGHWGEVKLVMDKELYEDFLILFNEKMGRAYNPLHDHPKIRILFKD